MKEVIHQGLLGSNRLRPCSQRRSWDIPRSGPQAPAQELGLSPLTLPAEELGSYLGSPLLWRRSRDPTARQPRTEPACCNQGPAQPIINFKK